MMWVIYKLISPSGGVYIGLTKTFKKRMREHKCPGSSCIYIRNAIQKYGWDNFTKEILFENVSEDILDDLEIYLIANYKQTGKCYNIKPGGHKHRKLSEETKRKIALSKIGKPRSKETIEKMSKALTGIPNNVGKDNPMYGKFGFLNHLSKPVLQYDLQGNFIKEWDSIADARRLFNNSHISSVCSGKRNSASGFKWEYK